MVDQDQPRLLRAPEVAEHVGLSGIRSESDRRHPLCHQYPAEEFRRRPAVAGGIGGVDPQVFPEKRNGVRNNFV